MAQNRTEPKMRPPTSEELKEMLTGIVEQSRKANPAQIFKFLEEEPKEKGKE